MCMKSLKRQPTGLMLGNSKKELETYRRFQNLETKFMERALLKNPKMAVKNETLYVELDAPIDGDEWN